MQNLQLFLSCVVLEFVLKGRKAGMDKYVIKGS